MREFILAVSAVAALAAMPAQAATIVVGNGTGGNGFPFGSGGFGDKTQYQQVYNKTSFSAPIAIQSVSFRRSSGGTTLASGTVKLSASTTNAAVDALSTDFASNIGADNRQVFSGTLQPNFNGEVLRFVFSTPFAYRPGNGNLLLNFAFENYVAPEISTFFLSNNNNAGGVYSRMHDFGSGYENFGLVTTFETSALGAVPEPATWAMLILGFGVIGGAMRSARRQAVRVTYA